MANDKFLSITRDEITEFQKSQRTHLQTLYTPHWSTFSHSLMNGPVCSNREYLVKYTTENVKSKTYWEPHGSQNDTDCDYHTPVY